MRRRLSLMVVAAVILVGLVLASDGKAAPDAARGQPLVFVTTATAEGPTRLVHREGLLAVYCKAVAKRVTGHSYFGVDIWWWRQRLEWCYEIVGAGGQAQRRITAVRTPRCAGWSYRILSSGVFWEFKGATECYYAPTSGSGVGGDSVTRGRMGHFAYCPAACVQNFYPWAKVTGRSDGTYSRSGGGAP